MIHPFLQKKGLILNSYSLSTEDMPLLESFTPGYMNVVKDTLLENGVYLRLIFILVFQRGVSSTIKSKGCIPELLQLR